MLQQKDGDTFIVLLFVSYSSLAYSQRPQFTSFLFNFVTVWFVHGKVPNSAVTTCVTNTQIKLENIFVTTAVPGPYPSLSPLSKITTIFTYYPKAQPVFELHKVVSVVLYVAEVHFHYPIIFVWIGQNFFIHSNINGHLNYFQFGASMNNASKNILTHFSWVYTQEWNR